MTNVDDIPEMNGPYNNNLNMYLSKLQIAVTDVPQMPAAVAVK